MHTVVIKGVTKPVNIESETDQEKVETAGDLVAYCARVSNPDNQQNNLTADRLLKYLVKHKHWSPFEMVNVLIEIQTTRDIARQILRHRSFSFQEFSQRYADPTQDLGFVTREARLQDHKNRQNSIESEDATYIDDVTNEIRSVKTDWETMQENMISAAHWNYKRAIKMGIAKEQARAVLPEGLTISKMYMNGTLRSWIHYCNLRMSNGTQKEHREIATDIWNLILLEIPALYELFENIE